MVDFSKLKKNSGNSLEKLTQEVQKMNKNENGPDPRFWYPAVDKSGNGYAVIRFLPAPGEEEVPFVRLYEHSFKHIPTGRWYIENSRTTLGKGVADPVAEVNNKLWNLVNDDESPSRKQARKQKRNLRYISNIYVIEDQLNPENNGKVFLFKYGTKIFDKINAAMNPQFKDEVKINPFDFWNGADFKLKIRTVDDNRNYDASGFASVSSLFDGDDVQLEALWKMQHSLQAFISPENFKTYEELKKRLDYVLGVSESAKPSSGSSVAANLRNEDKEGLSEEDAPQSKTAAPKRAAIILPDDDDDDMPDFSRFNKFK